MRIRSTATDEKSGRRFYSEIWPHAAAVMRSAQLLARNAAEADDLSQETLLKAFEAIDQLQSGSNAKSWLMTILRHCWIDRYRSKKAHPTLALGEMEFADSRGAPTADESDWNDPEELLFQFGDADIIDALRSLPDELRWTLLLVDVQGLPHTEAAAVLGVPVGTIKSRAHRGREMLRVVLTPLARELGFLTRESGSVTKQTKDSL